MDLMAELVLGYADTELMCKLISEDVKDFKILRYRDDYRIFVNSSEDGGIILKGLTDTMIDLGLMLNPSKTKFSDDVISSSIKSDKRRWNSRKQGARNIRKHLFIINDHSIEHPHSGSIAVAMENYYKRVKRKKKSNSKYLESPLPLISIVADIAYRNPRVYPVSAAIVSVLMDAFDSKEEKQKVIERILRKFADVPNTGHLQIWLQRISHKFDPIAEYDEPLCQLVSQADTDVEIWNNEWISSGKLKEAMGTKRIVDEKVLTEMAPMIDLKEFQLFASEYYGAG